MNTMDADVERFLKLFTLLDFETIDGIVKNHVQNPELRYGQKQLANYIITTVYGEDAADQAMNITEILFGQSDKLQTIRTMSKNDLQALQKETGGCEISDSEIKLIDIFTQAGLTESNGEAKKLIASGSLYCNEEKITDLQHMIKKSDFINGVLLLRKGKKQYKLVALKD